MSPEDIFDLGIKSGAIYKEIKATEAMNWIKKEFNLGQGYAQALWLFIKLKILEMQNERFNNGNGC